MIESLQSSDPRGRRDTGEESPSSFSKVGLWLSLNIVYPPLGQEGGFISPIPENHLAQEEWSHVLVNKN